MRGLSCWPASVRVIEFSRELRNDVLAGDITLSVRLWTRPRVKQGGRYRVGPGEIEVTYSRLGVTWGRSSELGRAPA